MEANPGKKLVIQIGDDQYARMPIKTHLVTPKDQSPAEFVSQYVSNIVKEGDLVFISEKIIAIMQGRSYPVDQIKPGKIAILLSKYVYRNPGGIGLAIPQTMQLAIEEAGVIRILLAALVAALTKPLGLRGMFYRIAGDQARAIDGPVPYAIPPYNNYASKGPRSPHKVAQAISQQIGKPVAIVDANDLGVRVLGASSGVDCKLVAAAIKDNPLGQSDESTPLGILRKIESEQ